MDNKKQSQAQKIGAVDALLAIAANKDETADAVVIFKRFFFFLKKQQQLLSLSLTSYVILATNEQVPALFSLRNLVHNNPDGKAQFGYRDGLLIVSYVLKVRVIAIVVTL